MSFSIFIRLYNILYNTRDNNARASVPRKTIGWRGGIGFSPSAEILFTGNNKTRITPPPLPPTSHYGFHSTPPHIETICALTNGRWYLPTNDFRFFARCDVKFCTNRFRTCRPPKRKHRKFVVRFRKRNRFNARIAFKKQKNTVQGRIYGGASERLG